MDMDMGPLLTPREVAASLRVSYIAVVKWMKNGFKGRRMRAIRAGHQYRTKQTWVDEFVTYMTEAGEAEQGDTDDRPATEPGESDADKKLARLGM